MATTPPEAFDAFKRKIVLTDPQKAILVARQENVRGYLSDYFGSASNMPLTETLLIGSAARGTMIRPFDDIDLMAVFSNKNNVFSNYQSDSQAFLYRVRTALTGYQVQIVGARGQAVRLFYKSGPYVDIAPVFKRSEGGYLLPNGSGGWLATDPSTHKLFVDRRDRELNFQLKPLVRMLKRWNSLHSKRLKSFHLEVLVANTFKSLGDNPQNACEIFFDNAHYNLSVDDPAGHSGDLSSYLGVNQRAAVNLSLASTLDRIKKANAAESAGNYVEALHHWRIIFGDDFPAYG